MARSVRVLSILGVTSGSFGSLSGVTWSLFVTSERRALLKNACKSVLTLIRGLKEAF